MRPAPVARIRAATMSDDDHAAFAAVVNEVAPERGTSTDQMRWLAATYPGGVRFLATTPDGQAVGAASAGRIYVYPPEFEAYWAEIVVLPAARRVGLGTSLLLAVSEVARAAGKTALHIPASQGRPEGIDFLSRRGFSEHDRSKAVRLDLEGLVPPPVAPPSGVHLVTLAARPDLIPAVHALAIEVFPDIPGGEPMAAGDLAEFRAREIDRPGIPWDGFIVALDDGGHVLGYASVLLAPARPTVAYHDLTTVRRDARGRGIAGALKRAVIGWAIASGLEGLEADNDEANLPMRAINLRLGYRPRPDSVTLRGPLFDGIMGT
jgi:GNAT superfamily N-acetyltransferase